jgi:hypothetical protein
MNYLDAATRLLRAARRELETANMIHYANDPQNSQDEDREDYDMALQALAEDYIADPELLDDLACSERHPLAVAIIACWHAYETGDPAQSAVAVRRILTDLRGRMIAKARANKHLQHEASEQCADIRASYSPWGE